jgi:hypothetical protein
MGVAPAPLQLFDLQADPGEQHDVSATNPETVARLRQLYDRLTKDAPAPRPPAQQPVPAKS